MVAECVLTNNSLRGIFFAVLIKKNQSNTCPPNHLASAALSIIQREIKPRNYVTHLKIGLSGFFPLPSSFGKLFFGNNYLLSTTTIKS